MKNNGIQAHRRLSDDANNPETSAALGMFDGLHLGHAEVIKAALNYSPALLPAAFTFAGNRPNVDFSENITTVETKFSLLKQMGIKTICAPEFESVHNFSGEEFIDEILVDRLNARHVSCGWNFRFSKGAKSDCEDLKRLCAERGIAVTIIEPIMIGSAPVSSTNIRALIKNGDIKTANSMLGRELSYELNVVEGGKLARKLGAPTINQVIPAECVVPKFGVYKSVVARSNADYRAVTNIGVKPTIGGGVSKPLMETHLLNFNEDIYGEKISVKLLNFLREESRFESLDALKEQIKRDIEEVWG